MRRMKDEIKECNISTSAWIIVYICVDSVHALIYVVASFRSSSNFFYVFKDFEDSKRTKFVL